jgi:DNA-binding GntR family transcriptional regulator
MLYKKIYDDICDKIKLGYYSQGDILPSEKEMEKIYGVSKAPIRQALSKLSTIGLIERKAGKGTFVKNLDVLDYITNHTLSGYAEAISKTRACKCVAISTCVLDDRIAEKLNVKKGTSATKVTRIREQDGQKVIYMTHYLPYVDEDSLKEEGNFFSMRYLLIYKFGFKLENVIESLTAVIANDEIKKKLCFNEDLAVMRIERISLDENNTPRAYMEYYARSDIWNYKVYYHKKFNE